jgi:glycosyltransferase involved in cell wall biosynthesis
MVEKVEIGGALLPVREWSTYLLGGLRRRIDRRVKRARQRPVFYDVNSSRARRPKERALLAYQGKTYWLPESSPEYFRHQSIRRCKLIAALLGELGFVVDVAASADITGGRIESFRFARDYDLVISDRADMMGTDADFRVDARKIYLARTMSHRAGNINLKRRYERLTERRSCKVVLRGAQSEHIPYVLGSHAIVAVGNERSANTWRDVYDGPIYSFNNAGYRETEFRLEGKDFNSARENFLFFASRSQVRKGLDLLLEIFPKHPDLHLYVCSRFDMEPDFSDCYRRELYETPNVHPVGWVTVNSPEFYDLVRTCAYVIHTACIEGQAHSVVQCMYAGLIPLVTRETGIDTDDFGITFAGDELGEIERVVLAVSRRPEAWHRERSIRTRAVSERLYSEDAQVSRWRDALTEILDRATAGEPGRM